MKQNVDSINYSDSQLHLDQSDDIINVGKWEWNIQTGETVFDERWASIIGYTIDELMPISIQTWINFTHVDDLSNSKNELERLFNNETKIYEVEVRMRHKNDKWVWVLDRGTITEFDSMGKPLKMIGTHYDITYTKFIQQLVKRNDYLDVINNTPVPIIISNLQSGRLKYINNRVKTSLGYSENVESNLKSIELYVNPGDRELLINELLQNNFVYDYELELYNFKKDIFWAQVSATLITFDKEPSILVSINNISEQKFSEQKLRDEEEKYHLLANSIADVIWLYNIDKMKFTYFSPSVFQLTGYTVDEAISQRFDKTMTKESADRLKKDYLDLKEKFILNPNEDINYIHEIQQYTKSGKVIWVETLSKFRYNKFNEIEILSSSRNIDVRKKNEERIEFLYLNDISTGLLNKTAFRLFEENLKSNNQIPDNFTVVYIDIDNFSRLIQDLGYYSGDLIINEISQKLKEFIGTKGDVYHYDYDEFIVILKSSSQDEILKYINYIKRLISQQMNIKGQIYLLTSSIGYEVINKETFDSNILKNSRIALDFAKKSKNSIKKFSIEMLDAIAKEAILEKDLRVSLENNELELYYQPIYNLRTGLIDQAEALLRWNHPQLGVLSPLEFIPIADRTHLIIPITDWVIHEVCQKLANWNEDILGPLSISLNLSFLTIVNRNDDLFKFIKNEIIQSGIKAKRLKIEITESSLVLDSVEVIKIFIRLRELGISLAIDDFGTGYSSFAYLKSLPLDIVKIDRSLIQSIEWDQRAMRIVESMITILHNLDLEVTIEGVESKKQFELLKGLAPDCIQGYLFSKPLRLLDFKLYYFASKDKSFLPIDNKIINDLEIENLWLNEWNSGNATIDYQHKELFVLAKKMESISNKNNTELEIIKSSMDLIIQKIKTHFQDEIDILIKSGYPFVSKHELIHNELIKNLTILYRDYKNKKIDFIEFAHYLEFEVIHSHFQDEDKEFFKYVSQLSSIFPINYIKTNTPNTVESNSDFNSSYSLYDISLHSFLLKTTTAFIREDKSKYNALINKTLEFCGKEVKADRTYIFVYDWANSDCSNTFEWCAKDILPQIDELQNIPLDAIPDWVNAHVIGETINIPNVLQLDIESNVRKILEPQGVLSLLTVPMMSDNVCYGFIGFDSVKEIHIYTDYELNILRDLGTILLSALK
jgi:diguanylate cyclase (GGDEF)-like protein/hemerythrin-like metal-binding protein/PAS domain S-box-containing protein